MEIWKENISQEKNDQIKAAYDRLFSDKSIAEEQLAMAKEFEFSGMEDGQEW
jgi:hypothetical protein